MVGFQQPRAHDAVRTQEKTLGRIFQTCIAPTQNRQRGREGRGDYRGEGSEGVFCSRLGTPSLDR